MKKKIIFCSLLLSLGTVMAQEKKSNISGGFENNSQWYLNDKNLFDENLLPTQHPEQPFRSNSYLFVNYKIKNFTFGVQTEGYYDKALLNLNPKFEKANIATYFAQYKNEKIEATLGYFYEQFGSGLLLRSWEDRALGINNALRGARFVYKPTSYLTFKTLYGQQRTGFEVSEGKIYGFDTDFNVFEALKKENSELSVGFTFVGRNEKTTLVNPNFTNLTYGIGGRFNYSRNSFYASGEYNFKSKDAVVQVKNQIDNNLIKSGSALLFNMGYSKKGFGIDGTFRRLENMGFYSERLANKNAYNDMLMNYVPSLTKQHHYNLANIYVYQSQPGIILNDPSMVKAGEIGGQIDLYYNFKKGTHFGGKYGTKLAVNFSQYHGLSGDYFIYNPQDFQTKFIGFGQKYFSDINIEITKKWNSKWQSVFSYINQYYNKKFITEQYGVINTNILAAEAIYKFGTNKSIRAQGEHLWADADKKNWASLLTEFNLSSKYTVYVTDMYNYGNDEPELRQHYFTVGNAYRLGSTRVSLSYGRQRDGLVCVGGVCRYVPASSGFSFSINTSF
ncbi:hypothetical protein Q361_101120 [Flavobacterium croceum DSM 17960]|uniref:Uncharacterized protein n=1 Tax=Flavobacterium croceum DSM 17960 TaxID=1121886 RepID=A0A2S4NBF2_9FLAO|nr:DUF6029 family protein [Flavobacterium croceum]POS03021.1 hypothetical protein Q361_101120 [Flavobacterium croceum DSM 17960]